MKPWGRSREIIQEGVDFLGQLALGCSIWSSDYVFGPLDKTKNRIYSAMYVVETPAIDITPLTDPKNSGMTLITI